MMIDYHCHILPEMDDGAENLSISLEMLKQQKEQGVECVVATPHYHAHRENVSDFIARREKALATLESAGSGDIRIVSGAEVALERGLSEQKLISRLTMGATRYILIELPYTDYKPWMIEEIHNICHVFRLRPILAHVDRYLDWYSRDQIDDVLSIREAIIQINYSSLENRKKLKWIVACLKQGYPLIFGTDAHNTSTRPPNATLFDKILKRKVPSSVWESIVHRNRELITGARSV